MEGKHWPQLYGTPGISLLGEVKNFSITELDQLNQAIEHWHFLFGFNNSQDNIVLQKERIFLHISLHLYV